MSTALHFTRDNIEFNAEGVKLKGWLYLPLSNTSTSGKKPTIVMAGGYATTKEMYTDDFAQKFCENGFNVLVYDHRGFGESEGTPRLTVDPWQQIEDYRNAITFVTSLPQVDEKRIGIWGSSYSGGECIVVAATDRRVKCVAAQVPTIFSSQTAKRRVNNKEAEDALTDRINQDRLNVMNGADLTLIPLYGEPGSNAAYTTQEAINWYSAAFKRVPYPIKAEVTLKSVDYSRGYNPGAYLPMVSPTPMLMVIGERDYVVGTDIQLEAFNNLAYEPKSLHIVKGAGHFDVYTQPYFESVSDVELAWFQKHLIP